MKIPFVNLGLQYSSLRHDILQRFDEISMSGEYVLGETLSRFESEFANYCGTRYALGVGNGTDALFMSMVGLGVNHGDEIITAPNSFIASAGTVGTLGAIPIFVDVLDDYNLDPAKIEAAISPKTKAIMPVHLTGRIAEMDTILEIANRHNLLVIEDASQAVGAIYKGKRAGSIGDIGCFSLHPLKNLHVHGDGGMIVTNNTVLYQKLVKMRNHGLKNRDECELWGYNSRLDSIQAAIASIKLKHLDKWNERYREIASTYSNELSSYVKVPIHQDYESPVYHRYVIQTDKRDALMNFLLKQGVETKINYPIPLHLQKPSRIFGYKQGDYPIAEKQSARILSLPLYPELKDSEVAYVIAVVKSFFTP